MIRITFNKIEVPVEFELSPGSTEEFYERIYEVSGYYIPGSITHTNEYGYPEECDTDEEFILTRVLVDGNDVTYQISPPIQHEIEEYLRLYVVDSYFDDMSDMSE